jgi:addiction module HigA family antidote
MPASTKQKARRYPYDPDYTVAPGETLEETIALLGISQQELARRADLSPKHVNQVIKGIAPISNDTALRLERVTGVPARLWNNLEANYRADLTRLEESKRLRADLDWLKTIPTAELIKRRAIPKTKDKSELLASVLSFFGVASVAAWKKGWLAPQFAFRKSAFFEGNAGAMAAWLRLGERKAIEIDCKPYHKGAFHAALDAIRRLTVEQPELFVPRMISLCAQAGVAVALVPQFQQAPVSGAAKWLTPTKAMICLNPLGKRNDHFWFTFFHEAGHVLHDSRKETYVDVPDNGAQAKREENANRFAATILIPTSYNSELPRLRTHAAVAAFARKIGIAPGIVIGRLQRDGILDHQQFNARKH